MRFAPEILKTTDEGVTLRGEAGAANLTLGWAVLRARAAHPKPEAAVKYGAILRAAEMHRDTGATTPTPVPAIVQCSRCKVWLPEAETHANARYVASRTNGVEERFERVLECNDTVGCAARRGE